MAIDEGGFQKGGSLSDYVSGKLNDLASQKSETKRQIIEEFTQGTVLLRAHLHELAKPMDELLEKFSVSVVSLK